MCALHEQWWNWNGWHCTIVFSIQEQWWHATLDVVRPCMLSMGDTCMPCPTSFIMCVFQEQRWHVTSDIVWRWVLPNEIDGMLCPTSSDHVIWQKAMWPCRACHYPILCGVLGQWYNATHNVIRSCMISKGDYNIPHPILSDRVCCLRAMMTFNGRCQVTVCAAPRPILGFHARRSPIVCTFQWWW